VPSRERPADRRHSLPGSPFSPVRFADEILRNTGIFAYFAAKGGAVSLRFRLAGGEGEIRTLSTTLVGSPLPRTQGSQAGFAKSSVCDRQQFAHPGLQSRTSPRVLEKTRDRMPCRYSAAVFSARVVRETIAKYGQFLLFRRRFSEISLRPRLNGSANGNRTRV
jgi:hypothetical protein